MKEVITVIGLIFVFGAAYQIINKPVQSSGVLLAATGDVSALSQALTGR